MTFSGELAIFLAMCLIGLVASCLSLRYAWENYAAARNLSVVRFVDQDIIDGALHFRNAGIILVAGWADFLLIGIIATLPPPPPTPVGATPIGLAIRYMLLSAVGLWALKTTLNFIYGRKQWLKHRPS